MGKTSTVVTVLGADHTGIIANVATRLSEKSANITDIRQTVLGDIFSMTMKVDLDEEKASFNEVHESLQQASEELGVQILIQREDVFKFMYNID